MAKEFDFTVGDTVSIEGKSQKGVVQYIDRDGYYLNKEYFFEDSVVVIMPDNTTISVSPGKVTKVEEAEFK